MDYYYLTRNKEQKGPVTFKELIELGLPLKTLVWKKGMECWTPLKDLEGFGTPPPIPKQPEKTIIQGVITSTEKTSCDQTINFPVDEVNPNPPIQNYGGFLLRLPAQLIDTVILFFLYSSLWKLFQLPIPENGTKIFGGSLILSPNLLLIIPSWLYSATFESSYFQATPGKILLRLKIVNENLHRINFEKATGRYFGKVLSGFIFGIGFLMILLTDRKQGFHDQMAHTLVLKDASFNKKGVKASWIIIVVALVMFVISLFLPINN